MIREALASRCCFAIAVEDENLSQNSEHQFALTSVLLPTVTYEICTLNQHGASVEYFCRGVTVVVSCGRPSRMAERDYFGLSHAQTYFGLLRICCLLQYSNASRLPSFWTSCAVAKMRTTKSQEETATFRGRNHQVLESVPEATESSNPELRRSKRHCLHR